VPTGTIMIAAITLLIGFQLLMGFLNYDISSAPREAMHPYLDRAGTQKREKPVANAEARDLRETVRRSNSA
jgi:hypothetical protein